jgi:hypothetical protein
VTSCGIESGYALGVSSAAAREIPPGRSDEKKPAAPTKARAKNKVKKTRLMIVDSSFWLEFAVSDHLKRHVL